MHTEFEGGGSHIFPMAFCMLIDKGQHNGLEGVQGGKPGEPMMQSAEAAGIELDSFRGQTA